MHQLRILVLSATITAVLLAGCERQPSTPAAPASTPTQAGTTQAGDATWQPAVDAFIQQYFEHFPVSAANAGKHEFDGRLPDYSLESLQSTIAWLHAQRDRFAAFGAGAPGKAGLDDTQRFQRDYVLSVIDAQLFWLEDSGFARTNPAFYSGDLSPSMYLTLPTHRCRSAWRRS